MHRGKNTHICIIATDTYIYSAIFLLLSTHIQVIHTKNEKHYIHIHVNKTTNLDIFQGRIQDFFPGGVRVTVPQRRRRRLSGRYGGGFGGPPPRKF